MTTTLRTISLALVVIFLASCSTNQGTGTILYLNPDGLFDPVAGGWTNVVVSNRRNTIHVAGQVPKNEAGVTQGIDDMGTQVRVAFEHVRIALAAVGATPEDVVRMTTYTLDIDTYMKEGYGQVSVFYNGKPPASTLVEVSRLADPDYLVEIEVTAVLD